MKTNDEVLKTHSQLWPRWFSVDEFQKHLEAYLGLALYRAMYWETGDRGSCELVLLSPAGKRILEIEGNRSNEGWRFFFMKVPMPVLQDLGELHMEKVEVRTVRREGQKLQVYRGEDGTVKQEVVLSEGRRNPRKRRTS